MSQRTLADDRLDKLYMKAMRCPYCHTKIPKGSAACPTCGISKEQIYRANLVIRKKHERPQVLLSKVRPANIPFWKMALGAMFGFFGTHCFVAKRYWRGSFILACTILFFVFAMIFNAEYVNLDGVIVAAHPVRADFTKHNWLFPTDLLGLISMVLWIWDWICILIGTFKYPVVIATEEQHE